MCRNSGNPMGRELEDPQRSCGPVPCLRAGEEPTEEVVIGPWVDGKLSL
jgi:hypothetical protein